MGIVGPGRVGTALARALRDAGVEVEGPVGRGERPAGLRRHRPVRSRRGDRRRRRGRDRRRPAGGAYERRHPAVRPGARRGARLRPAPASVLRAPGRPLRGRRRGRGGHDARGARLRHRARGAARHAPVRDRRRGSRRLPRRRLGGLELPRDPGGGRGGDRRRRRPRARRRARAPHAAWCGRRSRTWPSSGPERALTGPVARGDDATVEAQRAAVEETAPELLALFDELVERTRALAAARRAPA